MWEEILNLAVNNGLWAVLFLGLLIYQLKDSRTREQKYQSTILELNKNVGKVNKIDENIEVLTEDVVQINAGVKRIESNVLKLTKKRKAEDDDEKTQNLRFLD